MLFPENRSLFNIIKLNAKTSLTTFLPRAPRAFSQKPFPQNLSLLSRRFISCPYSTRRYSRHLLVEGKRAFLLFKIGRYRFSLSLPVGFLIGCVLFLVFGCPRQVFELGEVKLGLGENFWLWIQFWFELF